MKLAGQVLEIAPSNAAWTVELLRDLRQSGRLALEEIELHGALVHVVATGMDQKQTAIERVLREAGIEPGQMAIIEPSLEDVFIASMR